MLEDDEIIRGDGIMTVDLKRMVIYEIFQDGYDLVNDALWIWGFCSDFD